MHGFLITSWSATFFSLLKSAGTVFSLSTSIISTCAFKLAKSDITANLNVSTPVSPFKSVLSHT